MRAKATKHFAVPRCLIPTPPVPSFTYTAIDPAGQKVDGTIELANKTEVFRRLERQSLTPINVELLAAGKVAAAASKSDSEGTIKGPIRMSRGQVIHFTEELADLIDAGLQLEQALKIMYDRQEDPIIRTISSRLRSQIREGVPFSRALALTSNSFDDLYCNLVSAGEAGGAISPILKRLTFNLTQIQELQARVVQAMIYPMFMIGACILLMVVFMTVLVPRLTMLLEKTGQQLPLATQLMINASKFLASWWWLLLAAAVTAVLVFRGFIATPKGKLWWHAAKLKIPLFGPVGATRFYTQFCQTLGNLVQNGVPLLSGLRLMGRASNNVYLKARLAEVIVFVGEGGNLSRGLKKAGGFPELLSDMLAIGEQTGKIGQSLNKAAARYDKELNKKIKRLTTLISPVIIIFMAAVVSVVAYSIVTAIFQSVSSVRSRT